MGSVVTLVLAEWFSPLRPRPSSKTAVFRRLEVVPTTLSSRSPPRIAAEPARSCGVQGALQRQSKVAVQK